MPIALFIAVRVVSALGFCFLGAYLSSKENWAWAAFCVVLGVAVSAALVAQPARAFSVSELSDQYLRNETKASAQMRQARLWRRLSLYFLLVAAVWLWVNVSASAPRDGGIEPTRWREILLGAAPLAGIGIVATLIHLVLYSRALVTRLRQRK